MLLIIAATPLETSLLRQQLSPAAPDTLNTLCQNFTKQQVCLLHTGIGPVSTALNLTRFLENNTPQAVLMIGCGGSYPGSELQNGDLALATSECFGDLGVMTDQGFLPLEQMAIPVTPPPLQNFPLETPLQDALEGLLSTKAEEQKKIVSGPFVTVCTCSGHPELSRELEARTGGICENMEGAAAAQVCADYQIPFLELRGISNPTGTRDPAQWDLQSGAAAAQWGAVQLIDNWKRLEKILCNS